MLAIAVEVIEDRVIGKMRDKDHVGQEAQIMGVAPSITEDLW